MMRNSRRVLGGMHTGQWTPGTRGQKHMTLCPTHYLYRISGHKGPGVYMMKYWWTLGMFPTGMETPFRLGEFLAVYKQQHVPLEVEEWLTHFIKNPADEIVPNSQKFVELLEAVADVKYSPYKKIHVTNVKPMKEALDGFLTPLGVSAPASALRSVASDNEMKEEMLDYVYAYRSVVEAHGSTPHRRWAAADLSTPLSSLEDNGAQQQQKLPGAGVGGSGEHQMEALKKVIGDENASKKSPQQYGLSNAAAQQIGWALEVDGTSTAPDETLLINSLTTLARGSSKINKHEDAALTLTSALNFSHDDETRGGIHRNIASARCSAGDFEGAEWHAKEAVVLTDTPRSYATWASAVANQDKISEARDIIEEGLAAHETDAVLMSMQSNLEHITAKRPAVPANVKGINMQGIRARVPGQFARGLADSPGIHFGHEFDTVQFKDKRMPFKMDVRNNNMGSIFRRANIKAAGTTSTMAMEAI